MNIIKRALRNHAVRFFAGSVLGVSAALLVMFNMLLVWVISGPRSLDRLTPYIEAALQPLDKSYTFKIAETWLIWGGWEHPIDIRLRNISVLTSDGQVFSSFPEISLGVDVLSLPLGQVLPTMITITHPVISLFQNEDRSVSFGFKKETMEAPPPDAAQPETIPFAAVLAPLLDPNEKSSFRRLQLVNILDANVSVGSAKKGVFFTADDADIRFRRLRDGQVQASARANISYGTSQSIISTQAFIRKGHPTIDGDITFNQLIPSTLAALFIDNSAINAIKLPMTGKAQWSLSMDGVLQELKFIVQGGQGSIDSDKLDGSIPVTSMHAEGQLSNNGNDIQISRLTANLDGMMMAAAGMVSLREGDAAVQAQCGIRNVTADKIHMLWPPSVSPLSRQWIMENIKEGIVPEAQAKVNIAFGDLAKPSLPKEAIDASINLQEANIRYLPEHPEVNKVGGTLHIDGVSLTADIASGEFLTATHMQNGTLVIEDLNADNPYIKVNFDAETNAKDVIHFLGLPRLKHASHLNLHEDAAEGHVKGRAAVGFYFFAPKDENGNPAAEPDVDFDVDAQLANVTVPGFMHKFDIKNADGAITVKNSGLEFKGKGEANGASVSEANIKYLFHPEKGLDTFIDVTARAPVGVLPRFGYPAFPFLTGTLGVKASVKQGDAEEYADAAFNLTDTAITMDSIGWRKADKEPATLDISSEKKGNAVTLPALWLKSKDFEAKGSGALSNDLSELRLVTLETYRNGDTDLEHMVYEKIDGGYRLEAKGNTIDLSPWLKGEDQNARTFSFQRFPALRLKADVGRAILSKGRELKNVKGEATCDVKICSEATISAQTPDGKPLDVRIMRNPKGKRQFSLHAENAGAFLKAVNFFDSMDGGDLTITGNYDDGPAGSILRARADINEHVIKDAPVLAKILSLASLTGFFDTLQGNGIRFTRLRAPFTLANDVITIKDAKTFGSAIGLTADGTITFPKRTLDIEGTVVPSYTLNNVFGKVPIVGPVLTGGEEGGGVFAARYKVTGDESDPKVSVNPLSMLTPGFLRGLFDIFDKPKKGE